MILVGHGSAVILRDMRHVLRVRVTVPERIRAERIKQQLGIAESAALEHVRESDRERTSRIRYLYHVHLGDPLLYDLTINTERLSVAEGVRLVREAMQDERVQPSQRSLGEARDASLRAQAQAYLLANPATRRLRLAVTVTDRVLTVSGPVEKEASRAAALEIVGRVPGLAGVTDQITVVPMAHSVART